MTQPTTPTASPADEPLLVDHRDGVRTLTFNRPAAFNSFNGELKAQVLAAVRAAAADDDVRCVVLTGCGPAFSAGQDLKEHLRRVQAADPGLAATVRDFYTPLVTELAGMRKPVLASINGVAAGAGAAIALACDLRIAARSASLTMAFAGVALAADSGASFTLPRLVGPGRAMRMLLLGERVNADEALRIGLVDEVVDDEQLSDATQDWAHRLADGPTGALGWIKKSVAFAATHTLEQALAFEDRAQAACFASEDHREALDAFIGKRAPRFRGHHVG